jgi:hypothetical protein
MKRRLLVSVSEDQEKILNYLGFTLNNCLRACLTAGLEPGVFPERIPRWKTVELEESLFHCILEKSLEERIPIDHLAGSYLWEFIYVFIKREFLGR